MINLLLDIIYPPSCEACGTLIPSRSELLCIKCRLNLSRTDYHKLRRNPVAQHFWGRLQVERATSFLHFREQSICQQLIHKLKYEGRPDIGVALGRLLASELKVNGFFEEIDLILPIPMHKAKQKKRGYNQAERLAYGVALQTSIEISTDHLLKGIHTESQTKKGRAKRFENVRDSFSLQNERDLDSKHILLIDDVITTGSTLEACGRLLKDRLDCRLSILTLAATD
ncbi:MAG: amidophosphoribosyltransferase [Flavobacteriales bacterium]|nr:amidophosphoribosyltransferase [Flavobacteriales bacterium]